MPRPGLLKNIKFLRLSKAIGSVPLALGSLELIWDNCYAKADASLGSPEDVELVAMWNGGEGVLFNALLNAGGTHQAGFIEEVEGLPGQYRVHDLMDNAPAYVARRRQKSMENERDKKCDYCGCEYTSGERRSKYCSDNCRKNAFRAHKREQLWEPATQCDDSATPCDATATENDAVPIPIDIYVEPSPQPALPLTGSDLDRFESVWKDAPTNATGRDKEGDWTRSGMRGSKQESMTNWKKLIGEGYTARELRGTWILYMDEWPEERSRRYMKTFAKFFSATKGPGSKRPWFDYIDEARRRIQDSDARTKIVPLEKVAQ